MTSPNGLEAQLEADLIAAMKARDEVKLQVLRLLKAALQNYQIEIKGKLSPQQMLQILQKEAKKRQDSITQFADAGRQDLVDKETTELEVLKGYLPEQPDADSVRAAVKSVIVEHNLTGQASMGQVVAAVREHFAGAADGAMIAQFAREELASSEV